MGTLFTYPLTSKFIFVCFLHNSLLLFYDVFLFNPFTPVDSKFGKTIYLLTWDLKEVLRNRTSKLIVGLLHTSLLTPTKAALSRLWPNCDLRRFSLPKPCVPLKKVHKESDLRQEKDGFWVGIDIVGEWRSHFFSHLFRFSLKSLVSVSTIDRHTYRKSLGRHSLFGNHWLILGPLNFDISH